MSKSCGAKQNSCLCPNAKSDGARKHRRRTRYLLWSPPPSELLSQSLWASMSWWLLRFLSHSSAGLSRILEDGGHAHCIFTGSTEGVLSALIQGKFPACDNCKAVWIQSAWSSLSLPFASCILAMHRQVSEAFCSFTFLVYKIGSCCEQNPCLVFNAALGM